jgi:mono/diheme cytochrome c family protein
MTVTKNAALATVAALALGLAACSSSTDDTPTKTDAGGTSGGLSTAFSTQCSRCHGPTGLGAGRYPRLPGKPDADSFIAFVRAGKDEMPSFTAAQISDADLRSDFAFLSTR